MALITTADTGTAWLIIARMAEVGSPRRRFRCCNGARRESEPYRHPDRWFKVLLEVRR